MNRDLNDLKLYVGLTDYNYQRIDYSDGELAIINHLTFTPRMHTTQTNMVFIAMCCAGFFSFEMNGAEVNVEKDDVFIGSPNAIYSHYEMSPDLSCRLICISQGLLLQMLYPYQSIWNKTLYLKKYLMFHLSSIDAELREHLNALLTYNLENKRDIFQKEIIRSLIRSMLYEICCALYKEIQVKASTETNQKKILFDRFISLLTQSEIKKHPLSYYADILCVSPRYLTMACRDVSDKTAYDWIREYVQNDVRYYLLHTNLTIKEISIKLGFCNLSFFGKYVRENFGQSPSDFRRDEKGK